MLDKSKKKISLYKKQLSLQSLQKQFNEGIEKIQELFIKNTILLIKIRKLKLYQLDYLYNTWEDYFKNRVELRADYSDLISKYFKIIKMFKENKSFMKLEDFNILGYKKLNFLSYKYFKIKKSTHPNKDEILLVFKNFYSQSLFEFKKIPIKTYKKAFKLRLKKFEF